MEIVPPGRIALNDCGSVSGPPTSTMWSIPSPPENSRPVFPFRIFPVVQHFIGSKIPGPLHFFLTPRNHHRPCPHHFRKLQGKQGNAAGTLNQYRISGFEPSFFDQGTPGGEGSAGRVDASTSLNSWESWRLLLPENSGFPPWFRRSVPPRYGSAFPNWEGLKSSFA